MKLIAIYNVWDSEELLEGSIRQIREHVDFVYVVYQVTSNAGEYNESGREEVLRLAKAGLVDEYKLFTPNASKPMHSETRKRQIGINYAREKGFTHFLHMDCDEYYDSKQFAQAKAYIDYESIDGSVCKIQTYYKRPTLKFSGLDDYYVPFIHKIAIGTRCGLKHADPYPFYADPTRRIHPHRNVIELQEGRIIMHHFSYIRKDIEKKLQNSTARINFDIPEILRQYENAEAGTVVAHYNNMRLVETENRFNINLEEEGNGKNKQDQIRI